MIRQKKPLEVKPILPGIAATARAAAGMLLLLTLLLGVIYPLLVTSIAQTVFHAQANGSLIERNGKVIGSELLGQEFTQAKYFWGRLSATTPPYNAAASAGSNFSPANPKALAAAKARLSALARHEAKKGAKTPADLVTASGSGLDPHISVEAAEYQVARVAHARGMKELEVRALMEAHIEENGFGFLGAPYVNVLLLNLALDQGSGAGGQGSGKSK